MSSATKRAAGATAFAAVSILILAGGISGADARGLRAKGHHSVAAHRADASRPASASRMPAIASASAIGLFDPSRDSTRIVTRSIATGEAQPADETAPIPPMPSAPAAKPVRPWCPSGRVAGAGEGFCLIN